MERLKNAAKRIANAKKFTSRLQKHTKTEEEVDLSQFMSEEEKALFEEEQKALEAGTIIHETAQDISQKEAIEKEKEERLQEEENAEKRFVHVISGLVRGENTTHLDSNPEPTKKLVKLMYRHPLKGLLAQRASQEIKALYYLPVHRRMHAAVARNNAWALEELVLQGHEVNIKNPTGYTPLHVAASYNFYECVMALLQLGAEVNVGSLAGFTPTYIAHATHSVESYNLLKDAGGLLEIPKKVTPGFRTVCDVDVNLPRPKITNAKAKSANLGRRAYYGQF